MVFDKTAFEFADDPRYNLLSKKIRLDKDSRSYEILQIPPCTASTTYAYPSVQALAYNVANCWNADGSTVHAIEVYAPSDMKPNFSGCMVAIKYKVFQERINNNAGNAFIGAPIVPLTTGAPAAAGWSIPWNPLYWFQTVSLKLNNAQVPIEQYIQPAFLQHISTLRFLTQYKRQALEGDDSFMLTPCIESDFDSNAGWSAESIARAQNWMGATGAAADAANANPGVGNRNIVTYQKLIPLSAFFECCKIPAVFNNVQKLRFEFMFKAPQNICFQESTGAINAGLNLTAPAVCITDMKLIYDSCRMQANTAVDTSIEKSQGLIENVSWLENQIVPVQYTPNAQMLATSQSMIQSVCVSFLATSEPNNHYINPLQMDKGGLTNINCIYGSDQPMKTPVALGTTPFESAIAYMGYKKVCGLDNTTYDNPPVSFRNFDTYHMYWFPIYSSMTAPHLNESPKDVRIDSTSAVVGNRNVNLCMRKLKTAQIDSLGNVDIL